MNCAIGNGHSWEVGDRRVSEEGSSITTVLRVDKIFTFHK